MLTNISWLQWNYFWFVCMWNHPRGYHIFLFCHFSRFLEDYYCTSPVIPKRGFLVAVKSLLESAQCLLEVVSHSTNGFFCLVCQKNIWNKVARLGQHLSARLHYCLVHPLLLSSSNYLLHEAFRLTSYGENISYSETGILSSLPVEDKKWRLFGHWLHFNVCNPLQVWEIIFCATCQSSAKAF